MKFTDTVAIAGTRRRDDGYLVADARVARTGIQLYAGWEVGRPDMEVVRVYRPADEVFSHDAMSSFAHRPVTNDHPDEAVTADNWKEVAVGQTAEEVARDGSLLRVPLMVADSSAIRDIEDGKRELSSGYSAMLDWTAGRTEDGEGYDAVQRNIRANHVAIVRRGRAGADVRIGDDAKWGVSPMKDDVFTDANELNRAGVSYANSLVRSGKVNRSSSWSWSAADGNRLLGSDGDDWTNFGRHHLGVDTSADEDTKARYKYPFAKGGTLYRSAIIAIRQRASQQGDDSIYEAAGRILRSIDRRKDMDVLNMTVDGITIEVTDQGKQAIEKLQTKLSDAEKAHKDELDAKDKELAAKDAEIDDLKGKVLDEAALDAKVAERADLITKAKAIAPDIKTDGVADADIRKAAVVAKLGDAAVKDKQQAYIDARFDILAEDIGGDDKLRDAITHLRPGITNDAAKAEKTAHQAMIDRLTRKKSA